MQVYTAPQLGPAGPGTASGVTPTTARGLMLGNYSPWWFSFQLDTLSPFTIPPFSVFQLPLPKGSMGWTMEPLSYDTGGLSVGQLLVELDFAVAPIQMELRPLAQLPVYQVQVGGGVDILNEPSVNIANTPSVTIDTAGGPVQMTGQITGSVSIDTSGGPVSMTGTISGTVSIDTAGGPVAVNASGSTVTATIDTSGGPVEMTGTVNVGTLTSISDPVNIGGTVSIQGVSGGTVVGIAGTVDIGNTPSVTIDTSGGAVPITGTITGSVSIDTSGGAVPISGTVSISDITAGSITIVGGQGGVNVSTDSPPVAGPSLSCVSGQSSATDTQIAPANATALSLSIPVPNAVPDTDVYSVVVSDVLTGEVLAQADNQTGGLGTLIWCSLPLSASVEGYTTTVSVQGGGKFSSSEVIAKRAYYLGTTVIQTLNNPQQGLSIQGTSLGGGALPIPVLIQGDQGAGAAVAVVPESQSVGILGVGAQANTVYEILAPLGSGAGNLHLHEVTISSGASGTVEYDLLTSSTAGSGVIGKFLLNQYKLNVTHDFGGLDLGPDQGLYVSASGTAVLLVTASYSVEPD